MTRSLSFRTRLALATGAAVALTVIVVSVIAYAVVANRLRTQVDDGLRSQVSDLQDHGDHHGRPDNHDGIPSLHRGPFETSNFVQFVSAQGKTVGAIKGEVLLPVTATTRAIAQGAEPARFEDMTVRGVHLRVLTAPVHSGLAVQIAQPLADTDAILSRLSFYFLLIAGAGTVVAIVLGALVARTALIPVRRLTRAVEDVTATRDLRRRIEARGTDELGRLAASFNTMLAALDQSIASQRQLVADASHELRTPLTSLRTNLEVMLQADRLEETERRQLTGDLVGQIEEMTGLVSDIVELARDQEPAVAFEEIRLDQLVADAISRVARHYPSTRFEPRLAETVVTGVPQRVERAVTNLLDNAGKWSRESGTVEVVVSEGAVTVRDHGQGIAPEDLPHIFNRFYRSTRARGMPGSGLGLAIVRQVAESHGGSVTAANAHDDGAVFRLTLPVS